MPSSGYGIVDLIRESCNTPDSQAAHNRKAQVIVSCAQQAMDSGMIIEWLESFVAAWEKTKDCEIAAQAGIIEWDL